MTLNQQGRAFMQIEHPQVSARISLEGAHITHCTPTGQRPLLWMSPDEPELPGKTIRGGIPICWPWFSNSRPGAAHGIARTSLWRLTSVSCDALQVTVTMSLPTALINEQLPGEAWQLDVEFILGRDLQVTLTSQNLSSRPQTLSQALHSYLPVTDIESARVEGLAGCTYINQLTGREGQQTGAVHFTEETDRIYFDHSGEVSLLDAGKDRLLIARESSDSLVVWNPWKDKSLRLTHFPRDGYQQMVCLEAANAGPDTRTLQPGEIHQLSTRVSRVSISEA